MRSLALLALLAAPVAAFQPHAIRPLRTMRPSVLAMKVDGDDVPGLNKPAVTPLKKSGGSSNNPLAKLGSLVPKGVQTALFALAALSPLAGLTSLPADAAPSGGRAGGSSFRSRSYSAPQTRRYATPPGTTYERPYSRGYIERVPIPVPVLPFSPYGGFGFGFGGGYGIVRPFGFMSGVTDIIIIGGVIYLVASLLKSAGGSNWDLNEDEPSSLGSGVTVLKLQVGLQVPDRSSPSTVLSQLDDLARTADVSTRQGLAQLVSATALALLRSSNDWVSASGESKSFGARQGNAESEYSRLAIRERSKFEREENVMERRATAQNPSSPYYMESRPTLAVVTLCVAIRGQSTKVGTINSVPSLKAALQNVAADAMTDEGDNVLACEVLWTPQNPSDVLTKRDLITDYPELIDI